MHDYTAIRVLIYQVRNCDWKLISTMLVA